MRVIPVPEDFVLKLLCDGPLQLCRLYLSHHGKCPKGLIEAILAEVDRFPVWWQVQFYNTLLRDYQDLAGLFLDADDDDDEGDDGPTAKDDRDDKKHVTLSRLTGLQSSEGYHQ